jgi:hypothetical protein
LYGVQLLTNLELLDVSYTRVSVLSDSVYVDGLGELDEVSRQSVTDPAGQGGWSIQSCARLHALVLDGCMELKSLTDLINLPALRQVSLVGAPDFFDQVATLEKLRPDVEVDFDHWVTFVQDTG